MDEAMLRHELDRHIANELITSRVNTIKSLIKLGVLGLEVFLSRFLKLKGWAAYIARELDTNKYNGALEQVYRMFWKAATPNPMIYLGLLIVGSAVGFHFQLIREVPVEDVGGSNGGGGGGHDGNNAQAPSPAPAVVTSGLGTILQSVITGGGLGSVLNQVIGMGGLGGAVNNAGPSVGVGGGGGGGSGMGMGGSGTTGTTSGGHGDRDVSSGVPGQPQKKKSKLPPPRMF
jgi:hypothetical protein